MNMQINEKAAYVRGLIEGLELDPKDKQTKVFKQISELLVEMAQEIKDLEECYDDVCDQVDAISEDLAGIEDVIGEEMDDDSFCYGGKGDCEGLAYEVTCPTCGNVEYTRMANLQKKVRAKNVSIVVMMKML